MEIWDRSYPVQLFWLSQHNKKIELDKIDPKFPLWGGLIAIAFTYGLFVLFQNVSLKNKTIIAFKEQELLDKADSLNFFAQKRNQ